MKRYLIGLDAGTTSLKGVLLDQEGRVYATAVEEYTPETQGVLCELDAEVYWENTKRVLRTLLERSGADVSQIAALAFSSQGETLIPVDEKGEPLRKAIVWLDNRSGREAREIREHFGQDTLYRITGQPAIVATWPATRIAWLRKHEPAIFRRTHKYLLVSDYLVYRLTGRYVTEESLISSTLYFDFRKKRWWPEMLDYLGIDEDRLPVLLPPGTTVAAVTAQAAADTGLGTDTLVVTGAYDHPAGALGAGNIDAGIVTETTGGAMAMCVSLDEPLLDPVLNLPCHCHAVPGKYFLLPYGQTAGMVLRWFRDTFGREEISRAAREGRDAYDLLTAMAEAVPPGSDGLTMLPHLMGTGSPEFDNDARGLFAGITLQTTKGHFVRAILEAVAAMVRANLEPLREKGFDIREIRALGGGARSPLWNQIKADMLQTPLVTLKNKEVPSLGAAILAGTGSGLFSDLRHACSILVRKDKVYLPDRGKKKVYDETYNRYRKMYLLNRPLWYKAQ